MRLSSIRVLSGHMPLEHTRQQNKEDSSTHRLTLRTRACRRRQGSKSSLPAFSLFSSRKHAKSPRSRWAMDVTVGFLWLLKGPISVTETRVFPSAPSAAARGTDAIDSADPNGSFRPSMAALVSRNTPAALYGRCSGTLTSTPIFERH